MVSGCPIRCRLKESSENHITRASLLGKNRQTLITFQCLLPLHVSDKFPTHVSRHNVPTHTCHQTDHRYER